MTYTLRAVALTDLDERAESADLGAKVLFIGAGAAVVASYALVLVGIRASSSAARCSC